MELTFRGFTAVFSSYCTAECLSEVPHSSLLLVSGQSDSVPFTPQKSKTKEVICAKHSVFLSSTTHSKSLRRGIGLCTSRAEPGPVQCPQEGPQGPSQV